MSSLKMKIESRENIGSNRVNKLRANEELPGVIYKRGSETKTIKVLESEFLRVYKTAGTTSVIDLDLNGKLYPVIIKDIQRHPVKNQILHIDFQELNMDEAVKIFVPINLLNRDSIKLQPSILTQMLDHVEIECLPNSIPSSADINVEDMNYGDSLYVKDLDIASNEAITIISDVDTLVCTLSEPAVMRDDTDEDTEEVAEVEASEETE